MWSLFFGRHPMHVVKGSWVGREYQVQPPLNKAITCPTMVQALQLAAASLHYPVNALGLWIQAASPQETGPASPAKNYHNHYQRIFFTSKNHRLRLWWSLKHLLPWKNTGIAFLQLTETPKIGRTYKNIFITNTNLSKYKKQQFKILSTPPTYPAGTL